MPTDLQQKRPVIILVVLSALAIVAIIAFMTLGAKGSWAFVLKFRGIKLAALLLVAYAIAVSTVMFQTVTNNRILTPAVMGFDSLFVLVHTFMVFAFGSSEVLLIDPRLRFIGETLLLVFFAGILFRWLFSGGERSLHLLVLVGIIFGVLFRSLSSFMQRVLDPNEFMVLQDTLFASFNTIDTTLLAISAAIVALASLAGLRLFHTFDVLSLGRPAAISLGVAHKRVVTALLVLISIMVAVSTALVGPVMFFGLLIAALAHYLTGSGKHRHVLPAAILIGIICLVGGQVILERVFAFDTALSIVIEFLGGIVFIVLILKRGAR
ncbi:iron complex transport system permease protein [Rhizobium sp. BIGb0125]|uniref:iron chelate uptake ABC transporter family permease subunit n=1 Tax=Rhizobium sp. BIGb0125 TaxID=2940618 RepID=UPI00216A55DC|nr:iron chelate uptake ABC transporter family permease subunit [Rhizobium sp. BIGb0125]MCS4242991.1 iron complex transport system permease protein [Rhizobium sp. BIGb0125]